MIDCHTHVGEAEVHIGGPFLDDASAGVGAGPAPRCLAGGALGGDGSRVETAVVLAFVAPAVGFNVPNEYVADYVRLHPDKLIGFASVDPNDPEAPDQLEHAATCTRPSWAQARADLPALRSPR